MGFPGDETPVPVPVPLPVGELPADTIALARFLLGRTVVRMVDGEVLVGRIVETEAYPPGDPAAHHYRRMTPRNRSLFGPLGTAYVYRAYGVCWMLNVASETAGVGAGVLIRAVEPATGIASMRARRGDVPARDIARGPGRLAAAFAIDRSLDGVDMRLMGPLYLGDGAAASATGVSVRIGITRGVDSPWRFYIPGDRHVSGPARLNAGAANESLPRPANR